MTPQQTLQWVSQAQLLDSSIVGFARVDCPVSIVVCHAVYTSWWMLILLTLGQAEAELRSGLLGAARQRELEILVDRLRQELGVPPSHHRAPHHAARLYEQPRRDIVEPRMAPLPRHHPDLVPRHHPDDYVGESSSFILPHLFFPSCLPKAMHVFSCLISLADQHSQQCSLFHLPFYLLVGPTPI